MAAMCCPGHKVLTHCDHWCHVATEIWVNTGSDNDSLLADGTNPFHGNVICNKSFYRSLNELIRQFVWVKKHGLKVADLASPLVQFMAWCHQTPHHCLNPKHNPHGNHNTIIYVVNWDQVYSHSPSWHGYESSTPDKLHLLIIHNAGVKI